MAIETRITEVVVYPDRARITREAQVTLETGEHHVEIAGLPLKLDVASLRVTAYGLVGARLSGAEVQRAFFTTTPTERLRELEARIEATQDALRGLAARKAWLDVERASLEAMLKAGDRFAAALAFGRLAMEDYVQTLQHVTARAQELDAALIGAAAEERSLQRQLEKLQQEYQQYAEMRPREQYRVGVDMALSKGGTFTLRLSYVIQDASWTPLYDLRVVDEGLLEVGYLAQVTQRTGEAWDDVALTLSTARPGSNFALPELTPWPLDVAPPPGAPVPMMMRAMAMDERMAARDVAPVAEEVPAAVVDTGNAVTYHLPARVTIPPDGTAHKVTVARFELKPKLDYVTAPKQEPVVYRRARFINASSYLWLAGEAALFWQDEFVGRAALAMLPPGAESELAVGIEDRVKVERKLVVNEVDRRLVGDRRRIRAGYEITLENLLETPIDLELRDQIPYARHEQIKVRLENASPTVEEQELGLLRWTLRLDSRAKRKVRFEFSIEYPTALKVTGLP